MTTTPTTPIIGTQAEWTTPAAPCCSGRRR